MVTPLLDELLARRFDPFRVEAGTLCAMVYGQDRYWVNVHGEVLHAPGIPGEYRKNIQGFLRQRCGVDQERFIACGLRELVRLPRTYAVEKVSVLRAEIQTVSLLSPGEWVVGTRLYRSLGST